MREGFEVVRTIRLHIRRGAVLLDEGRFDEATAEVEAALAIDPESVPAQALRDRIAATRRPASEPARAAAPIAFRPEPASRSFVPHGVNAASWRGFEQRITERRFKALLETINTSIVAGNARAAQAAFEEARELRPDDPVLKDFEARVAAVPVMAPLPAAKPASRIWMRAAGAAALLIIGVSLLFGIEWMRPEANTAVPVAAPVATPASDVTPTQDTRPAPTADLGPVPVASNDEESVPAIITPPEPLLRPTATTGSTAPTIASRAVPVRETPPPVLERRLPPREVEDQPEIVPRGEVPDEFVAPRSAPIALNAAPVPLPSVAATDVPVTADARGGSEPAPAAMASVVSVPSTADQQNRVEEVLRRYARAYGQLDASAARAVWPSVDERALARAFQNLSSQKVSFDACDIQVRGVVANASCRGEASYAPKVGNRESRTEPRNWRFELRRDGEDWQIVDVDARRQSTIDPY